MHPDPLHIDLLETLRSRFGHPSFRPGQKETIKRLLRGEHILAVLPTGSGKSLCYQLPALLLREDGPTFVISPLIALMKDQVDTVNTSGILRAVALNSTLPPVEMERCLYEVASGLYDVIYAAPERLTDQRFLTLLGSLTVPLLVIDEAHCISEWGHDFRPDYLRIGDLLPSLRIGRVLALTATATLKVRLDIIAHLGVSPVSTVVADIDRPNLFFEVHRAQHEAEKLRILRDVVETSTNLPTIIYVGTRYQAEEVSSFLRKVGRAEAAAYHAGMTAGERTAVHDGFMSGRFQAIVATGAFGLGIDKPDIRAVVHHTLPSSIEEYYQEAGRAGRDGVSSRCLLIYTPTDRLLRERQITGTSVTAGEVITSKRHKRSLLRWMINYAESKQCRREMILSYFGEKSPSRRPVPCCDICDRTAAGRSGVMPNPSASRALRGDGETISISGTSDVIPKPSASRFETLRLYEAGLTLEKIAHRRGLAISTVARHLADLVRTRMVSVDRCVPLDILDIIRSTAKRLGTTHRTLLRRELPIIVTDAYLRIACAEFDRETELLLPDEQDASHHLLDTIHRLRESPSPQAISFLIARLTNPDPTIRSAAAAALGTTHAPQAIDPLVYLLDDTDPAVVTSATRSLGQIIRQGIIEQLSDLAQRSTDPLIREAVSVVLKDLASSLRTFFSLPPDPIETFLAASSPLPLTGPFDAGYALDWSSRFSDGKRRRTLLGDLIHRFKYGGDLSVTDQIVDLIGTFLHETPAMHPIDLILPVPPSHTDRPVDPVSFLATQLAHRLGLEAVTDLLCRARIRRPQKELDDVSAKRENIRGAFRLHRPYRVRGRAVLLFDDLYDSGATVDESSRVLRRAGVARIAVLTLTRTIHHHGGS
ncbi:MAG: RecQ family ATP-dependent DNA helicase [Candidatus Latescibacteria bacterium]|nr:RecQ family ATP-dependent DNA helicase [Candidatus Latescibacterota bacterium]